MREKSVGLMNQCQMYGQMQSCEVNIAIMSQGRKEENTRITHTTKISMN